MTVPLAESIEEYAVMLLYFIVRAVTVKRYCVKCEGNISRQWECGCDDDVSKAVNLILLFLILIIWPLILTTWCEGRASADVLSADVTEAKPRRYCYYLLCVKAIFDIDTVGWQYGDLSQPMLFVWRADDDGSDVGIYWPVSVFIVCGQ